MKYLYFITGSVYIHQGKTSTSNNLGGTAPPTPNSSKINTFGALSQNYQHLLEK